MPAESEIMAEKPEEQTGHTDTGEIDLSENADIMDEVELGGKGYGRKFFHGIIAFYRWIVQMVILFDIADN